MAKSKSTGEVNPRKRTARPFPAATFEEALEFAKELFVVGSGQPVRRLTLFDHLGKAPDSGASRMLITNSNKYGLTKGSYVAEQLELTEDGRKAVDDGIPKREQAQVRAKLAIVDVEPFRQLYLSVHYIVSHNKEREKLAEHAAFSGLKAELQIRTVLQHAWAVLDRKLRYNNEEDIPRQVRRKLFRVSALLETADENFSEIDKIVGDLREQYASDIKGGNLEQEINLDSLEVFMRESASVKALEHEAAKHYKISLVNEKSYSDPEILKSVSNLVMSAHLGGIKTIRQLNDVVVEFNKIARETFLHLIEQSKNDAFTTAGLIRLALVYVAQKEISAQILRLVPFSGKLQTSVCKLLHPGEEFDQDRKKVLSQWWVTPESRVLFHSLTRGQSAKPAQVSKKRRRGRKNRL